ncbi:MAG: hypothetical protein ABJN65_06680 [Parasphingorhabdus sp.]
MRVVSSLADIDFSIGRIVRRGGNMVIESSADSTLETIVTVTPRDALKSLVALAVSPSAWIFVLTLPFALLVRGNGSTASDDDWEERRSRIGLNKPW